MKKGFIFILAILMFSSCSLRSDKNGNSLPNIILILLNNVGVKDLECLGGNFSTPSLNEIVKESIVFSNAYAASSSGNPSMVSIFSGKYPFKYNVYSDAQPESYTSRYRKLLTPQNGQIVLPDSSMIPYLLKSKEYSTFFVGRWGISNSPLEMGFDKNIAGNSNNLVQSHRSPYNIHNLSNGDPDEYLSDRLTKEALSLVKNSANPFFLTLSYYSVSPPFYFTANNTNQYYEKLIQKLDKNIGDIFNTIKSDKSVRKNTIFIISSVNGAINAISPQDPYRGGKGSYYDGGLRVPLIVKLPTEMSLKINSDVSLLDIYPSILEWCSLDAEKYQFDGINLSKSINQKSKIKNRSLFWHFPIYSTAYHPDKDNGKDPLFRTRPGSAIRKGEYKLIEYFENGEIELYNIKQDVSEQHNLYKKEKEIANEYLNELNNWRLENNASVPNTKNPNYQSITEKNTSNIYNSF